MVRLCDVLLVDLGDCCLRIVAAFRHFGYLLNVCSCIGLRAAKLSGLDLSATNLARAALSAPPAQGNAEARGGGGAGVDWRWMLDR